VSDGATVAYLADVYVLAAHRARGLGLALVCEILDGSADAVAPEVRWLLHTADAQRLYSKVGFIESPAHPPAYPLMERRRGEQRAVPRRGAGAPAPAEQAAETPAGRRQ
jgi:predicted N-acetyltransferase YhbS